MVAVVKLLKAGAAIPDMTIKITCWRCEAQFEFDPVEAKDHVMGAFPEEELVHLIRCPHCRRTNVCNEMREYQTRKLLEKVVTEVYEEAP